MSNTPDVFLGLVTHPNSTFNSHGQAAIAVQNLAQRLSSLGLQTDYLISDRNDFDPETYPLSRRNLLAAARIQSRLEFKWRLYVIRAAGFSAIQRIFKSASAWFLFVGMLVKRSLGAVRGSESASAKAFQRLINIDLSHHRVLSAGLRANSKVIIVLEDDASELCEEDQLKLAQIVRPAMEQDIDLVNLSNSISGNDLGVENILRRAHSFRAGNLEVVALDTAVTNTVCANLYSARFAQVFAEHIAPERLLPVKPIDWRLNELLLRDPHVSCWWVSPGLFVQGSMH